MSSPADVSPADHAARLRYKLGKLDGQSELSIYTASDAWLADQILFNIIFEQFDSPHVLKFAPSSYCALYMGRPQNFRFFLN